MKALILLSVSSFYFLAMVAIACGELTDYFNLLAAYKNGNCEKIEGNVSNFDPMPYGGHKSESFTLNGKKFSYTDFCITPGFNQTASHGGPLREGLLVRIWHQNGTIARLDIAK
jgi:hypothetical protein